MGAITIYTNCGNDAIPVIGWFWDLVGQIYISKCLRTFWTITLQDSAWKSTRQNCSTWLTYPPILLPHIPLSHLFNSLQNWLQLSDRGMLTSSKWLQFEVLTGMNLFPQPLVAGIGSNVSIGFHVIQLLFHGKWHTVTMWAERCFHGNSP